LLSIVVLVVVLVGVRFGVRSLMASDTLPNLVGRDLTSAKHAADNAGFSHITARDATGGGRVIIEDSHWMVCFQTPDPGSKATGTTVDLDVVKNGEICPARDRTTPPTTAGGSMPDLRGYSLAAAGKALPSSTSVTTSDASGRGRAIIVDTHWKICSQSPTPGAPLAGQSVTLRVVKLGESCPGSTG
jgi:membrane protein implicated in regulation of membrane protease activity